jgi:hypothetical protein
MKAENTLILILIVFGSVMTGLITHHRTTVSWQNKLIERNLAEWQVDAKTGKTEFVIFE